MGIIKDHSIVQTLKDGNLRNDPEVLDLICDVITNYDNDIDALGGIEQHSKKTDQSLEMLAAAIVRAEDEPEELDEEEDEDDEVEEDEEIEDEDDELDSDLVDEESEED